MLFHFLLQIGFYNKYLLWNIAIYSLFTLLSSHAAAKLFTIPLKLTSCYDTLQCSCRIKKQTNLKIFNFKQAFS